MRSIRRQLTRELLGAVFLLLGAALGALYFAARDEAIDQFDETLQAKALAISTLTQRTRQGARLDFSDRFLRGFDDDRASDFFTLWDRRGRVVARSDSMPRRAELPREIGTLRRPELWNLELPNGEPGRAIGFRFRPRGADDSDDDLDLVVASDREELDESLRELALITLGGAVLLLGATLVIIPRVLRRGLRPLHVLGEQVTRIDAHSLAQRLPDATFPEELHPIVARLNALLARLEASFERERRFSADLAHELRTPLAELRTAAECALKWPATREAALDRETLAIATHLERIVAHILALSRSEQGQLTPAAETVALDALLRDVWSRFARRAQDRGLRVVLELAPTAVTADPALLRSILNNLCDNAVDYSPEGGELKLWSGLVQDRACIRITNTVENLIPADVPLLFDRFWRKESARTSGQHVGLGLSLARTLAQAMGWTLTASLLPDEILEFTLTAAGGTPPGESAPPPFFTG